MTQEESIRNALSGATPGYWEALRDDPQRFQVATVEGFGIYSKHSDWGDGASGKPEADAAFIAACNPAAIRALLEELDRLRAAAVPAQQWLALADHMPRPEVFVLTWDGKTVGVDWWGSLRYRRGDNTTHWAPFEKPPGAGDMYGLHSLPAAPASPPMKD